MSILADFSQAILFDVVTITGFILPVFLGVFALGSIILGRK